MMQARHRVQRSLARNLLVLLLILAVVGSVGFTVLRGALETSGRSVLPITPASGYAAPQGTTPEGSGAGSAPGAGPTGADLNNADGTPAPPLWQSQVKHEAGWSADAPDVKAMGEVKASVAAEEKGPADTAVGDAQGTPAAGAGAGAGAAAGAGEGEKPASSASTPAAAPAQGGIHVSDGWVQRNASGTGIPGRALEAYANAALSSAHNAPGCQVGWNTLAAIGYVESRHGTSGGAWIGPDGVTTTRILGPILNGHGFAAISDTDGGALDGDARWDRAVGPFQFIPSTWVRYATRASGDGQAASPDNIDDAALSAARYLCAAGGDLSDPDGWTRAILAYNHSNAYVDQIRAAANSYAERSVT